MAVWGLGSLQLVGAFVAQPGYECDELARDWHLAAGRNVARLGTRLAPRAVAARLVVALRGCFCAPGEAR